MRGKLLAVIMLASLGVGGLASTGAAQNVHRDHFITFDEAVALPNGVVLPAGRYLFELGPGLQATVRQDLTQIMSEDRKTVFATLFTLPVRRAASDGFEVTLAHTAPNRPPVLTAWFCDPGGRTGHQFAAKVKS